MRLPLTVDALVATPKDYAPPKPVNPERDLDRVAVAASEAARAQSKQQHRAAMNDARYWRGH